MQKIKNNHKTLSELFRIKIKRHRKANNYSLKRASKLTGVSRTYINRLENNKRENPSINIVMKVLDGFEITNEFFDEYFNQ